MIATTNDRIRTDYKVFLEPMIAQACSFVAERDGTKTRSKFLRKWAIIGLLIEGYPLDRINPEKYGQVKRYINGLRRGMAHYA